MSVALNESSVTSPPPTELSAISATPTPLSAMSPLATALLLISEAPTALLLISAALTAFFLISDAPTPFFLICLALTLFFGKRTPGKGAVYGIVAMGAAFVMSLLIIWHFVQGGGTYASERGGFDLGRPGAPDG